MERITLSGGGDRTTGANAILNLFDETLGNNEIFVLAQVGRIDFKRTFTVHLKDSAQRTLLNIMHIPGNTLLQTETIVQISTTSGQMLLTGRGVFVILVTVWSGADGQYLGKLERTVNRSTADLSAKGAGEELLFRMKTRLGGCCRPSTSDFNLKLNGVTLASIRQLNNDTADVEIRLFNSRNFDSVTKVILIFAGYFLFIEYFAETSLGRTGANGLAERECYLVGCFFAALFLLIVLIAALVAAYS